MATGMLFECDDMVASKLFQYYKVKPMRYDRCIGLINGQNLTGAILFHNWNGSNVELSYYGPNTMTAGIVRCIARFLLETFDPSRLTVITNKRNKHLMRSFQRMGFRLEGMQRCYYGKADTNRNTGVRFVMFRPRIEEIARLNPTTKDVPNAG